jgi:hypothetical protein
MLGALTRKGVILTDCKLQEDSRRCPCMWLNNEILRALEMTRSPWRGAPPHANGLTLC